MINNDTSIPPGSNERALISIKLPFRDHTLRLIQAGLPVSQESFKLVEFTCRHCHRFKSAVDLGTGGGFLALALADFNPEAQILGLDIQPSLIETAQRNKQLNNMGNVFFQAADIRHLKNLPGQHTQDLVIANPPFRKPKTGKISRDERRSVSCHELSATLGDIARAASFILKHNGYFSTVIIPERLPEMFRILHAHHLTPTIIQFIHHYRDSTANTALILARKESHSGLVVDPPVFIEPD